ncbi:MAG: hypothetical protein ACRDTE_26650, partial [Pseudonocardiaceae bacterium]
LPPVQREALDIALLRSAHRAAVADHQAVSAAVLGVIRALAAEQPLVVAVDDAGWLDRSSERVLRYVIRRLSDESVGIAAAFRPAADHQLPLGLDRPSVPDRLYRLELGPLDPDMVHMLLSLHASTHAGSPGRSTGCVAVIRSTPWRSPVRCAVMAGRRSLTACCRCRAVSWRVPRIGWRR